MSVAELIGVRKKWLDVVKHKPVAFGLENGFEDFRAIPYEWLKSFLFATDDKMVQEYSSEPTIQIIIQLLYPHSAFTKN